MKKVRISLDVTPETKAIIEDLAGRAGIDQGELLRRGVALFNVAQKAREKGEDLAVIKGDEVRYKLVGY